MGEYWPSGEKREMGEGERERGGGGRERRERGRERERVQQKCREKKMTDDVVASRVGHVDEVIQSKIYLNLS